MADREPQFTAAQKHLDRQIEATTGYPIGTLLGDLDSGKVTVLDPSVTTSEAVEHPGHYGGDTVYEVIKVCEAWGLDQDAYLFNVVKYIGSAGKKQDPKLQDLKKARFYLDRRIALLEGEQHGG